MHSSAERSVELELCLELLAVHGYNVSHLLNCMFEAEHVGNVKFSAADTSFYNAC